MRKAAKKRIIAKDERGHIIELALINKHITTFLLITSKKGAVRANHYHRKDTHYTYLTSGLMKYTEQKLGSKKKTSKLLKPGDLVVSEPGVIHAMEFLQDSEIIVITTESRKQKEYEQDTVRIKLV